MKKNHQASDEIAFWEAGSKPFKIFISGFVFAFGLLSGLVFLLWCLLGRHAENGESIAQAAIRETIEETGLKVKLTQLVSIYSIPEAKAWVNLIILFVAEPVGGTLKAQDDEVVEIAFFDFDAIPDNLLWGHRQCILDATRNGNFLTVVLCDKPIPWS